MRDPGSTWAALPESGDQGSYDKAQVIVHSTGTRASAAANRRYFAGGAVAVESTFIVGLEPSDRTLQILDSNERADANGSANRRAISIEVVGEGGDPYTDWQIAELIRIGRWAARAHGIPLRVIPSEAAGGFGWHVMFGAPGPWTTVRGKVCPGSKRIAQLRAVVFPAIFAGTSPDPTPQEDLDVSPDELQKNVTIAVHSLLKQGAAAAGAKDAGEATATGRQVRNYLVQILAPSVAAQTRALIEQGDSDVDEAALAAALAPLLTAQLRSLTDADLAAIAQAVADENHRRTES